MYFSPLLIKGQKNVLFFTITMEAFLQINWNYNISSSLVYAFVKCYNIWNISSTSYPELKSLAQII